MGLPIIRVWLNPFIVLTTFIVRTIPKNVPREVLKMIICFEFVPGL